MGTRQRGGCTGPPSERRWTSCAVRHGAPGTNACSHFVPSGKPHGSDTPEDVRAGKEDQETVRRVLSAIDRRHAQLLLLRSEGFSYDELASTLALNPASVGT